MTSTTRIRLTAGLLAIVFFALAGATSVAVNASASRGKLVWTDSASDNDPPQVALGIAMGAFRGLFVNVLWIRANNLKEEGKYYEARDLSSAITKLQPRFPRVWVFHAWNLAYNISVTTQTREERWSWVNQGIQLLRDEGIPANPNDMLLHKELAWTFLHKIQGYTDDANGYYKRRLAEEWTWVLGPPPPPSPDMKDRKLAIQKHLDWFRPITQAPDALDDVINARPEVGELLTELRSRVGVAPDFDLLRRYEFAKALSSSSLRYKFEASSGPKTAAMIELIKDPRFADAWTDLLLHVRKRVLTDRYHMEPARMLRYMDYYGPLDWRHPGSHAVYWSARGSELALPRYTEENRKNFDFINNDRMTIQAVQELARSGEIYFSVLDFIAGNDQFYLAMPNVHFVQTYGDILQSLVDRSWADSDQRSYSFYAAGYENFLKDQVRYYFRRGQKDIAEKLYSDLRNYPHQNNNDPERPFIMSRPLAEFVDRQVADQEKVPQVAVSETVGALQGAYTSGLLAGNMEEFRAQIEYAKQFHRYYMDAQARLNTLDIGTARMEMMDKDFGVVAGVVFAQLCAIVPREQAEALYARAPDDLRVYAFDLLVERYKEEIAGEVAKGGKPFDELFPEPPLIAEHRAKMEEKAAQMRELQEKMQQRLK
ncbi:MAG: hypothetical protein HUU19_11665 [Phycisphaerales bacterium]|nr:hypothetical protein [Phycisphaerales bacterium]